MTLLLVAGTVALLFTAEDRRALESQWLSRPTTDQKRGKEHEVDHWNRRRGSRGNVDLTLTGKYPAGITADKVILQATCESGSYCVSNAAVTGATATEIDVYIAGFIANSATDIGNNAFLVVYIGQERRARLGSDLRSGTRGERFVRPVATRLRPRAFANGRRTTASWRPG